MLSGTSQDRVLTDIVDELLDLGLHAPVAELRPCTACGAHEGGLGCCARPVITQRSRPVLAERYSRGPLLLCTRLGPSIPHGIDGIWGVPAALSNSSPLQPLLLPPPWDWEGSFSRTESRGQELSLGLVRATCPGGRWPERGFGVITGCTSHPRCAVSLSPLRLKTLGCCPHRAGNRSQFQWRISPQRGRCTWAGQG